jgi:phosphoribosylglycinamide formyltransferase-1
MKKIVVFASGSGTNALNLIQYFKQHPLGRVVAIFTNNPQAGVIAKAKTENIPIFIFSNAELETGNRVDNELGKIQPDATVLAGFLRLFPSRLLEVCKNNVINIHPALLPKYGGKGMYGDKVHAAVLENKESVHGVTVHRVNEEYDKGEIILQSEIPIHPQETKETLVSRIHSLEYEMLPRAVEMIL